MAGNAHEIESLDMDAPSGDLKWFKEFVGEAALVCLGESRHDIREQFLLKNRLVKYLVEELDFTTFVLEASLPYSNQINDYILHEKGDLDEIMANFPGWFLWAGR